MKTRSVGHKFALPLLLGAALVGLTAAPLRAEPASPRLQFDVTEGLNINAFLRQGPVAAHLLLRSGADARVLVAFPAGNSGVGLWFEHSDTPVAWAITREPTPVTLADAKGRALYGMQVDAVATAASLTPKAAVLSSVRVLRDYQGQGTFPDAVKTSPVISGDTISWARDRADGAAGYRLAITVTHGAIRDGRLVAGADGKIGLRITAASGETPLTPLDGDDLLNPQAGVDAKTRNTLSFLAYREKFLAGSWRFDTYFGRDTLMSVRLLMPVLQAGAVEGGLRSVVARLSPSGEVAHEEGIGEFAVLDHQKAGTASDAPEFDYAMIDGNYMLAPIVAAWALDDPRGRAHAAAFLAAPSGRTGDDKETVGAALLRNLRLVLRQTRGFADHPAPANLLSIKAGRDTGQWRDSQTGLGMGRYPFDVNAVFAPAALAAMDRMVAAGLLDAYLTPADRVAFAQAGAMARVWHDAAPGYFDVSLGTAEARRQIAAYAGAEGVPAGAALASVRGGALRFHALSLNADGSPVAVVHSDEGFDLLFGTPTPASLDREVTAIMRPFPAGLMTPIGMLVANPAFAADDTKALFTRGAYHGLVVWSWQQAVLAAGLRRQLARHDLPPVLRAKLTRAQATLWQAINATRAVQNSELWSWAFAAGHYKVVPFGAGAADADESNAAQLWSSVFLALKPPAP